LKKKKEKVYTILLAPRFALTDNWPKSKKLFLINYICCICCRRFGSTTACQVFA